MTKVLKIALPIIAFCAMVAWAVCSAVIPEQTNQFIENVKILADRPIVIAGFTATVGGIATFVFTNFVLKNTKFGRKELDSMREDIEKGKKDAESKLDDFKNQAEAKLAELNGIKDECEGKISAMYDEFKDLKASLIGSLKTIPNKKVQEKVAEYEEGFGHREEEILKKAFDTNAYVDDKIAELEAKWKEFVKQNMEIGHEAEKAIDDKATEE